MFSKQITNVFGEDDVMLLHHVLAQNHGQELVVSDVLDDGCNDASALLQEEHKDA